MPRTFVRRTILVLTIAALNISSAGLAIISEFPAPQVVFAYALFFAEVGLTAIWSGLSALKWWMRAVGHLAVFAAAVTAGEVTHGNDGGWFVMYTVQSVSITGPLVLARLAGLRLARTTEFARQVPLQFTLRHLFAGMTAFAVLMGVGRVFYPLLINARHSRSIAVEACLLGAGFAAVALIAAWAAFGRGAPGIKLIVLIVLAVVIGWLFATIEPPADHIPIVALVVAQTALLALSLLLFRRAGYRLIRLRD